MGKNIKSVVSNLSVAFIANLVSLLGSTVLTLVLPGFIGIEQYAYYQLYIFYASYVGFFGIGWIEGIYLRYGGQYYDKIDTSLFSAQIRLFSVFETILGIIVFIAAFIFSRSDGNKTIVFACFAICIFVYMPRALLHNLLQTTGRIKEYAIGVIIEKVIHICLTTLGVVLGRQFFSWYIISDLIGRTVAAAYIFIVCRDIVKTKPISYGKCSIEIRNNIIGGLALMISNVAGMLVIGVMRQAIEIVWDIQTFGKISLTLTCSNLLMTFINSTAFVVFPMLKRADESSLVSFYSFMRTILMVIVSGMLIFYYPGKILLSMLLPQYEESLQYMAVLFPICVYESKMSLLINTYMKSLRKERLLLLINLIAVLGSLIAAFFTCFIMRSLNHAIFAILILIIIKCTLAEVILSKYIEIRVIKDIILELIVTIGFIISSWTIGRYVGVVIYIVVYAVYIFIKNNDIKRALCFLRK